MSDRMEKLKAKPAQYKKHLERSKRWKELHPEEQRTYHREYCRKWRQSKKNKAKIKKYNDNWKKNNPDYQDQAYFNAIKRKYGLTKDNYLKMVDAQNGICYICKQPQVTGNSERLYVDHNHETNEVRKLLCNICNLILGKCAENPEHLLKIVDYIREFNGSTTY